MGEMKKDVGFVGFLEEGGRLDVCCVGTDGLERRPFDRSVVVNLRVGVGPRQSQALANTI